MGVDFLTVGGYKLPQKSKRRAEKVKIYLSGEELALVDKIMEKKLLSTRPPVFRYLLYHYDDIERAESIVLGYTQLREKQKNFERLME
jgi:hypothetical protein